MSNSRMIEAVNRLIGSMLSGAGEVFLPGMGSLYAEQQGAKRVDKRTLLPPCRTVAFSSQPRGASLVDEIARAAGVDGAKAVEIYETWLSRTRGENTLTIEGVGELKFKNFTLTPEFDKILNPAGHAPVKIRTKRGFDWVLWLGVVAILIAGGLFGYQFVWNPATGVAEKPLPQPEIVVAVDAVVAPDTLGMQTDSLALQTEAVVENSVGNTAADAGAVESAQAAEQTASAQEQRDGESAPKQTGAQASGQISTSVSGVLTTVSGRSYVVLGVFSSEENAARAITEIVKKEPQWQCRTYRLGVKFMVSPFEGEDSGACARFIGEDNGKNPGMWTYNAR